MYAVYDPRSGQCRIANAGHMPPVRVRPGRPPELLDLPTGAPLGVGGVPFATTDVDFAPGDQLVLYTDGLVETRTHSLDDRLEALLRFSTSRAAAGGDLRPPAVRALRHPDDHDDVALLVARALPRR